MYRHFSGGPYLALLHRCPTFVGTSFRYPVKLHAPVVAMAVTYRKRRGLFCWVKRPGMTVTFSAPMYPDPSQRPKAAQEDLRRRTYEFLCQVTSRPDNVEYIRYEPKEAE